MFSLFPKQAIQPHFGVHKGLSTSEARDLPSHMQLLVRGSKVRKCTLVFLQGKDSTSKISVYTVPNRETWSVSLRFFAGDMA